MKQLKNIQHSIYGLACPYDPEYIWGLEGEVREENPNFMFKELKTASLIYLEELLKKDVLLVRETFDDIPAADSIEEVLEVIDARWREDLEHIDFYTLACFSTPEWYIDKLENAGYNFMDNWLDYVKKNQWLQDLLKVNKQEIQRKFQERLAHPPVISDKRRQEIQQKYREKLSLTRKRSREMEEKERRERQEKPFKERVEEERLEEMSLEELIEEIEREHRGKRGPEEKDPPKPDFSNKNFLQRLWYWLLTN